MRSCDILPQSDAGRVSSFARHWDRKLRRRQRDRKPRLFLRRVEPPDTRNADSFGYNDRSEVTAATIDGNYETHEYDSVGNSIIAAFNTTANTYFADNLYQYISILRASA